MMTFRFMVPTSCIYMHIRNPLHTPLFPAHDRKRICKWNVNTFFMCKPFSHVKNGLQYFKLIFKQSGAYKNTETGFSCCDALSKVFQCKYTFQAIDTHVTCVYSKKEKII